MRRASSPFTSFAPLLLAGPLAADGGRGKSDLAATVKKAVDLTAGEGKGKSA